MYRIQHSQNAPLHSRQSPNDLWHILSQQFDDQSDDDLPALHDHIYKKDVDSPVKDQTLMFAV